MYTQHVNLRLLLEFVRFDGHSVRNDFEYLIVKRVSNYISLIYF